MFGDEGADGLGVDGRRDPQQRRFAGLHVGVQRGKRRRHRHVAEASLTDNRRLSISIA